MKVKLFTASTIQDAMAQVRNEFGKEAIILHTRRFRRGGFLGFFAKEMVEVMAALDNEPPATAKTKPPVISPNEEIKMTALQLEMANMRKMMEQVLQKMSQPEAQDNSLFAELVQANVDPEIARNLLHGLAIDDDHFHNNPIALRQMLKQRIVSLMGRAVGINPPPFGCKVVAFVGPTGVGKTTTIAKLAAKFALKEGCRVALITSDTYRIAAVEQLKTYADIIGISLDIVYSPEDLKAALYRHRDKQLVLIDTAGRSPRNEYHLEELQQLLSVDPSIEVHLVLSATTNFKDAQDIVKKFSICSPQRFLFTKIDESQSAGMILNILYQFPTTLSYITNGQSVPDDIEMANPNKLVYMILRD